jgi:hypothetical protein
MRVDIVRDHLGAWNGDVVGFSHPADLDTVSEVRAANMVVGWHGWWDRGVWGKMTGVVGLGHVDGSPINIQIWNNSQTGNKQHNTTGGWNAIVPAASGYIYLLRSSCRVVVECIYKCGSG